MPEVLQKNFALIKRPSDEDQSLREVYTRNRERYVKAATNRWRHKVERKISSRVLNVISLRDHEENIFPD